MKNFKVLIKSNLFLFIILTVLVIGMWCGCWYLSKEEFGEGAFGDSFGALNTLFTGFAFAGLIVTIRQQSTDLQATKDEMRHQTDQFKYQSQNFARSEIKADIYRRINLIKQLEQGIEFSQLRNGIMVSKKGIDAINELSSVIQRICDTLFPNNESTLPLNITVITDDYLSIISSFRHIDAWLKSIYLLLEDIQSDFEHDNLLKYRYQKIALQSSHIGALTLLYTFHDTHGKCELVAQLYNKGIMDTSMIPSCILDKTRRSMLYSLVDSVYQHIREPEQAIYEIANQWRKQKGWQPFLPMQKIQKVSSDGYTIPLNALKEHPATLSKIAASTHPNVSSFSISGNA